jgi:ATP-dependent Lon protease
MNKEINTSAEDQANIPEVLPVLALRNFVAFPHVILPLSISNKRSIKLINDVMHTNRLVILAAERHEIDKQPGPDDLYQVGTVARIYQLIEDQEQPLKVVMQTLKRVQIMHFVATEPYLLAQLKLIPESIISSAELEAQRQVLIDLLNRLASFSDKFQNELIGIVEKIVEVRQLIYLIASVIDLDVAASQELLEINTLDAKLRKLIELLQHEIAVHELGQKIKNDTKERMSKTQREYFLREQIRAIQKELGEGTEEDQQETDLNKLRQRIEESGLPEEAGAEAKRELDRLANISSSSTEYNMIYTYLDWLACLPWDKLSSTTIDISYAQHILDEDHYNLEKIKERILEYLAAKKLRQERKAILEVKNEAASQGEKSSTTAAILMQNQEQTLTPLDELANEPILCFMGPPGVGKTSLGQSIARALGRNFIRISLGGIRDEAEIRGHRRTYIGAMPGRIIQNIKRAKTRNPVFMLDEIDKVGTDWRGDPSSALLEVLDPSQNNTFTDHYLGLAFDLSQVLFIATANTADTIPTPLLDRMEVVQLSGYTDEEKLHIAKKYLIPKQQRSHGLYLDEITFENEAISHIIRAYTREAGVRDLDRQIAHICRKIARKIAEGQREKFLISKESLNTFLGHEYYFNEVTERTIHPGVATGLAWTPTGGNILFIEATIMSGSNQQLILTGMLGDVMRESAQAALSYVRSHLEDLAIDPMILNDKIIHVHIPAGAIPKDGPSAGITIVTALVSLLSKRSVRSDIALTGEITLRGKVLPVGGIKEKILAAYRVGIKTVILPHHNEHALEDVPSELREKIQYIFVKTIEEVLPHVFA